MATTAKQIPMFFKCFNDVDRSEKLRLPESWCSYMGRSLPFVASLRNRYGDCWEVKVANYQNTDKFWFEDGWGRFVEENKLAHNDRIVFKYDGESTFDIMLFDKNGDEKEYVRIPNRKEGEEKEQLQDMELEQVVPEFVPEGDEQPNMHLEAEPEVRQDMQDMQDMQPEEVQVRQLNPRVTPAESEYSASDEDDEDYEFDGGFEGQYTRSTRKTVGRKRAPAINEEDEEAVFRRGFPRPDNPYFVTKRRCKRNELFVPTEVVRDFNLTFPEEIAIWDEKGNEWIARARKWKDNRVWLSRGWKAFCKWNNVNSDDWCIIEIVRPEDPEAQMYLKTHLVPAAALRAARRS